MGSAAQLSSYDAIRRELHKFEYLRRHEFVSEVRECVCGGFYGRHCNEPFRCGRDANVQSKVGREIRGELRLFSADFEEGRPVWTVQRMVCALRILNIYSVSVI